MRISKWAGSLALRLPEEVVTALGLKKGDDVNMKVLDEDKFAVGLSQRKQRAAQALRDLGWHFPADFKFDRDEANER